MIDLTKIFLPGFLCLVLSACDGAPEREYHGSLYFGAGNYVGEFNLSSGESEVVASVGDANVRGVHAMDDDRVLLAIEAFEHTRNVAKISSINVESLHVTALFQGTRVAWLPKFETYVYDDGARLAAVTHSADYDTDNVVLNHRVNAVSTIHVVSESAVIFDAGPRDARTIYHYDVQNGALSELDDLASICTLRRSAWVEGRRKLACRGTLPADPYVLVGLDGHEPDPLSLPQHAGYRVVAALPGQDALVVTRDEASMIGGRPARPVEVLDLGTGELTRLSNDQHLGESVALIYR